MQQLGLPLYNPRDRGRLNALRNIVAAVSDELRRQQSVAEGIVAFTVEDFPRILRSNSPFELLSADVSNPQIVSPYPFEILDLVQNRPNGLDVFPSISELVDHLDIDSLSSSFGNDVELIGIDESIVDNPLPHSTLTFLKSVAFRMYRMPNGEPDEAAGPILSEMRMQLRDDESFESENRLLGYIRNNFVAYVSALTSISFGRNPFVVLHGPLVRAIGGFSQLVFDYQTARELLNIDLSDAGEFEPPVGGSIPVSGDSFTVHNLSFDTSEVVDGDRNLHQFNSFCLNECGRQCASVGEVFSRNAVPPDQQRVTQRMIQNREYPGLCLYFWILRSLYDLTRLSGVSISSVVENVSAATEMTRFVYSSLLANQEARNSINQSFLRAPLNAVDIQYSQSDRRNSLYTKSQKTIERLRLSDSNLFSYVLAEGQYTAPVQIYRYQTRNTFIRVLNDSGLGIRNEYQGILDKLFSPESQRIGDEYHPGYRILMSYVRTSPLREPVRLEYFDLPHLNPPETIVGPIYLLSLPYQEYGMPIILYYADKLARTPTKLVRAIIEREYLELVLQNRFSDPVSIMRVLGRLTRNYLQREGLR